MKGFRGYVSRAQEGILSPNPSAEEYDRVPGPEAVRERASRPVLDRDDWDRPADRAVRTDPAAPADSTAPADPAADVYSPVHDRAVLVILCADRKLRQVL